MSARHHKLDLKAGSILQGSSFAWLPAGAQASVREAIDADSVSQLLADYCDHTDAQLNSDMRKILLAACAELRTHDLMERLRGGHHA